MSHTVLLIDDSKTVRHAAALVLAKELAFQLECWDDSVTILDKVHTVKPNLILLAHQVDGQDGYELSSTLRKDPSIGAIPFVMLTSGQTLIDRNKAHALGIVASLKKPFSSDEFMAAIRDAMTATIQKSSTLSFEPPAPGTRTTDIMAFIKPDMIEAIARQKIEEMVQEIVPQIAESLIREEIERLLRAP